MFDKCVELLRSRGVELEDIAECVVYLQQKHHPDVTIDEILPTVESIIRKREVQHAILTGITLDQLAESDSGMDEDLKRILKADYSLYGIDEVLAYGICNLYGSIALTNFGYIDREKPGIIGRINEKGLQCNTFLDDIVGSIAASAASKIAHTTMEE